jgi:hypothetical protein
MEFKAPDYIVFRTPEADTERFVIVRPEMFMQEGALPSSLEDARERWKRVLEQITPQSEEEIRHELAGAGLTADEIDKQFARARHIFEHPPEVVWERTTAAGSRNASGQVVVRKLDVPGTGPFERLFVLRCEACGHEHQAGGADVHRARCPKCAADS